MRSGCDQDVALISCTITPAETHSCTYVLVSRNCRSLEWCLGITSVLFSRYGFRLADNIRHTPKQRFDPFCLSTTDDFSISLPSNYDARFRGCWPLLSLLGKPSVTSGRFQTGLCLFCASPFLRIFVSSSTDFEPHSSSSLAGGGILSCVAWTTLFRAEPWFTPERVLFLLRKMLKSLFLPEPRMSLFENLEKNVAGIGGK